MLHVFVEGPDDESFFSKIYGIYFGTFNFVQYAGWPHAKINSFIYTIGCMPDNDYIFFSDADGKPVEERKDILLRRYSNLVSSKLFIVQYEIESWYYAGASETTCQKLKLKQYIYNTDNITKEDFYSRLPQRSDRKFIMAELLELYELGVATSRNTSLSIFDSNFKKSPLNAVYHTTGYSKLLHD